MVAAPPQLMSLGSTIRIAGADEEQIARLNLMTIWVMYPLELKLRGAISPEVAGQFLGRSTTVGAITLHLEP